MYKEIVIDVSEVSRYKMEICNAIDEFIGIHRVNQLSGIVYRGFVHETAIEELLDEIGWVNRYYHFKEDGFNLYIEGEMDLDEMIECNKVLKRKKWNGHSFVTTMGPV